MPLEVCVIATAFLQPEVRDALQFLHPFGLREGATEAREQMDVVFHAAAEDGRAIELFGDAAEIRVERVARGFVSQERAAVLGGEDQMNVNGGKGLWHGGRMVNRGGVCERESVRDGRGVQSQRDCGHQPKVGAAPTLGEGAKLESTPTGLWRTTRSTNADRRLLA
ncbi:MAG: hypothetical protein O2960_17635 [Verrucomicrobia bacterium]|nr:hypothetical protein [Verrucomicrobiota bacterium]